VQDPAALGQAAAELLFARIGGDHTPPRYIVVPTRLVARGSGEIRAEGQEP
jgi:LacI family transcriptional regulator